MKKHLLLYKKALFIYKRCLPNIFILLVLISCFCVWTCCAENSTIAWGRNQYGQTDVPPNLTNVVAIAAGGFHNLALKEDSTVVAWGDNLSGQIDVPLDLTNVVAIAAG